MSPGQEAAYVHPYNIGRCRRIKALRLAKGLSQQDLSHKAEVSQGVISAAERGFGPSELLLQEIANALGFTGEAKDLLDFVKASIVVSEE